MRLHIEITGNIQGVGFRPFCHNLAKRFQLTGWVFNHGGGLSLEVQGDAINDFMQALKAELPPLARIEQMQAQNIPSLSDEKTFVIRKSQQGIVSTSIPADSDVCQQCLAELFDPASRFYHYPFVNCTHCGPRYTVTYRLPYDRCNTALAGFELCPVCKQEYEDPDDRRYHAQATACPRCGPTLSMPPAEILRRLLEGEILAIKGLGGFHLVCDANNHKAVLRLRERKNRKAKPFAIMAANIASLESFVEIDDASRTLLESSQRPVVLLKKRSACSLSPSIAPDLSHLGVFLPYTPLHYLIFNAAAGSPNGLEWLKHEHNFTLLMTSANPGGEALVIDNLEAKKRLSDIADMIVDHDRAITSRCDDSVMYLINRTPHFIRRARGFVPQTIKLPHAIPSGLGVGGHLKNTICVTRGDEAFLSQHIGDMDNRATLSFFEETVQHLLQSLEIKPNLIAHDAHPEFYSSGFAQNFACESIAVQHHHAHMAAVAAEHGITENAIGLALDGFGLGEGGQSWGGELILYQGADYQRLGHLVPMKQPGGDRAAREPWRMAAAVFERLNRSEEIEQRFKHRDVSLLQQMLQKNINCPLTSSAGRLFDAAAGLLGIQAVSSYEGQAAMMLESLVTKTEVMQQGWQLSDNRLDFLPLLAALIDCDPIKGANLFHGTLICALGEWLEQNAIRHNTDTILLAGGCFLNRVLSTGLINDLVVKGFKVKMSQAAPINDGGISLGQVWVAGLKYAQINP